MIIGMLLIVLCLITLWLTSPRRRRLVRWHFQRVSVLSYQDWLDAMLSVIQMSIVVLVLFGYSARLNLETFAFSRTADLELAVPSLYGFVPIGVNRNNPCCSGSPF